MKVGKCWASLAAVIGVFSVHGQGFFIEVRSFLSTSVPGHHVDEFWINAPSPIRAFSAEIIVSPMNQVHPGGSLSVFPGGLSPAEVERDSHFTFDIGSATILGQDENTSRMFTSVEFNADHPTSFQLGRAVAMDGHQPYETRIFGTYLNGQEFDDSVVWVPEPSAAALGLVGLAVFALMRKRIT